MQLSNKFATRNHKENLLDIAKSISRHLNSEERYMYLETMSSIADVDRPYLSIDDKVRLEDVYNYNLDNNKNVDKATLLMRYTMMKCRSEFSEKTINNLLKNKIDIQTVGPYYQIEKDIRKWSSELWDRFITTDVIREINIDMSQAIELYAPELCVMDTIYFNVGMTDEQADKLYNSILDMMTEDTPENTRHKLLAVALLTVIVYPFTRVFATNILPYFTRKTIDQIKEAGFVAISDTLDAELSSVDKMYLGIK